MGHLDGSRQHRVSRECTGTDRARVRAHHRTARRRRSGGTRGAAAHRRHVDRPRHGQVRDDARPAYGSQGRLRAEAMKTAAIALAVGTMLTVEQRDAHRSNLDHSSAAISADGRFVAFTTYSAARLRRCRRLRATCTCSIAARQHVTLESADTAATSGDSSRPGISGDGRYVVFEHANVVMLRDRSTASRGSSVRATSRSSPRTAACCCLPPGGSSRLRTSTSNGERSDIYSLDLQGGRARRVSVDLKGLDASLASSVHPAASSDGRYVAFSSRLQLDGKRAQTPHVFVRDTELNTTRLVGAGWDPSLSGDGRVIAFVGLREPPGAHIPGGPHNGRDPHHHKERAARPRQRRERQAEGVVGRPIRGVSIGGQRSRRRGRFQSAVGRVRLRPHAQARSRA